MRILLCWTETKTKTIMMNADLIRVEYIHENGQRHEGRIIDDEGVCRINLDSAPKGELRVVSRIQSAEA